MLAFVSQFFPRKLPAKGQDEDALVSLFSNRAELKRQFAQQRDATERLEERLRQQEVKTLKAEQHLEQVESMLADPDLAAQAVAFYRFRGLWFHCRKRLHRFAGDVYETQVERERQSFLRDYRSRHETSLREIRSELDQITAQAEILAGQMTELEQRKSELTGFWNVLARRRLARRIAEFDAARLAVGTEVERVMKASAKREASRPPEFPGLSIAGKRAVNLQLIALAQELYLWFRRDELAECAREASICQVTDVRYGDITACQALANTINERIDALAADNNLALRVVERAGWLAKHVEYRNEHDSVPESSGLSLLVVQVNDPAQIAPINVNVLAQEYWDICSALLPS